MYTFVFNRSGEVWVCNRGGFTVVTMGGCFLRCVLIQGDGSRAGCCMVGFKRYKRKWSVTNPEGCVVSDVVRGVGYIPH